MTLPGALNLMMSENPSCEKFTPTSGPGGLLFTPGGKCCCTMNPAVRELKAFCPLLKNAAVPALAMAWATEGSAAVALVLTAQTPSTQPSRSVMATTALMRSGVLVSARGPCRLGRSRRFGHWRSAGLGRKRGRKHHCDQQADQP